MSLTPENRERAISRLNALSSYEAERGLKARMLETGMSKPGFFALLSRWRVNRSVASLLPRAEGITRGDPSTAVPEGLLTMVSELVRQNQAWPVEQLMAKAVAALPEDDRGGIDGRSLERVVRSTLLEATVLDLLSAHPGWSKYRIVEETRSRLDAPPAASTVRRAVERLRSVPGTESRDGVMGLGSRVFIASSPAVRRSSRSTEKEIWAHIGLVVDVATRTILGGSAAPRAFDAMTSAAELAAEFCEGLVAGGTGGPAPVLNVLVPDGADVMVLMKQSAAVGRVARWEQAEHPTDRTTPSALVDLVGRRLGVLDLRPRGAPETATEESRIVGDLLTRHLDRTRTPTVDLPPTSVSKAALVAALRAFAA